MSWFAGLCGAGQAACCLQTSSSGWEGPLSWSTGQPGVPDSGDAEMTQAALTGHSLCAERCAQRLACVISLHPQEVWARYYYAHFTGAQTEALRGLQPLPEL